MKVGIEKIQAYPCSMSLELSLLAEARGAAPEYPSQDLLVRRRSLNPPWEDPVTMAVNVALSLVDEADREAIRLVVVGTESAVDFGKPIAAYVHRYCGIQPNCRAFETKHACYSGTSALVTAAHWVAATGGQEGKALVVTTDQSRVHLGAPWEYVMGAGACAMLISTSPDVAELEIGRSGYWTSEVFDTLRPTSTAEVGNAKDSLFCYLEALEGAFGDFESRFEGETYDERFSRHIYHVPFGGITRIAHRTLLRRGVRIKAAALRKSFEEKVLDSLVYTRETGGTYSSTTMFALLGHLASEVPPEPGERLSVFSYGSGSTAEFYSIIVGERASEQARGTELPAQLAVRKPLSMEQYEALERLRTETTDQKDFDVDFKQHADLYESNYAGQGKLVFDGVDNWLRKYRMS